MTEQASFAFAQTQPHGLQLAVAGCCMQTVVQGTTQLIKKG